MSQTLMVRSCEPDEKLKGKWWLKRAALAHFECALKVLVGFVGVRLSQRRI